MFLTYRVIFAVSSLIQTKCIVFVLVSDVPDYKANDQNLTLVFESPLQNANEIILHSNSCRTRSDACNEILINSGGCSLGFSYCTFDWTAPAIEHIHVRSVTLPRYAVRPSAPNALNSCSDAGIDVLQEHSRIERGNNYIPVGAD